MLTNIHTKKKIKVNRSEQRCVFPYFLLANVMVIEIKLLLAAL